MTKTDPKRLEYLRKRSLHPDIAEKRRLYREKTREIRNAKNREYMREYNKTDAQRKRNRDFMKDYGKRLETKVKIQLRSKLSHVVESKKKSDRAYYLANREKFLERSRNHRLSHPRPLRIILSEKERKENSRRWRRNDYLLKRDRYLARAASYAKRHPEKVNHRVHLYRVRKIGAKGCHTVTGWKDKVKYYGWKCYYCNKQVTNLTKDHAIPLTRGGTDWLSNILPACRSCNSRKRTRTVFEWRS